MTVSKAGRKRPSNSSHHSHDAVSAVRNFWQPHTRHYNIELWMMSWWLTALTVECLSAISPPKRTSGVAALGSVEQRCWSTNAVLFCYYKIYIFSLLFAGQHKAINTYEYDHRRRAQSLTFNTRNIRVSCILIHENTYKIN